MKKLDALQSKLYYYSEQIKKVSIEIESLEMKRIQSIENKAKRMREMEEFETRKSMGLSKYYTVKPFSKVVPPELIESLMVSRFKISLEDLKGKCRKKEFTTPRHLLCLLLRENTNMTLEDIAFYMDKKCHGTIINAIDKAESKIFLKSDIRSEVKIIQESIKNYLWAKNNQVKKTEIQDRRSFIYSPIKKAS